ncbi:hypothetical protein ACFQE5_03230 [Pseudonocardia hispaniensis]|uniref:ATP synthase protein I n=2 Tax=Pseudonocardia hispaniensis TaxID=904933 RepID=A0ABW1IXZ1_9PSEU
MIVDTLAATALPAEGRQNGQTGDNRSMFTASYIPPNARSIFRMSVIGAGIAALLGLAALIPLGHGLGALFGILGLALGVGNSWMILRSTARYADSGRAAKSRLATSTLSRLAIATVIALLFAALLRPEGLGVLVGLAMYQPIAVVAAAVPMIKELRRS